VRARNLAARHGWLPPLAWDDIDDPNETPDFGADDYDVDPVVVRRLLEGQRIKATHAEKVAALAQWVADGNSKRELCDHHGWNDGRFPKVAELRLIQGGAA
jgi:hypothetical protein